MIDTRIRETVIGYVMLMSEGMGLTDEKEAEQLEAAYDVIFDYAPDEAHKLYLERTFGINTVV